MSLEGVRSYKRTSSEQRETLSDILACNNTISPRNNSEISISTATSKCRSPMQASTAILESTPNLPNVMHNQPSNTQLTNIQTNTKNSLPGTFNFTSCTLNFHIHN